MDLQDKVILITGGSMGIGLETAKVLQAKGALVIINARDGARLKEVGEKYEMTTIQGDVSLEADVKRIFNFVIDRYGRLDALINNAGYGYFDSLENMDVEKFNQVFATNVTGAMMMAREAAKIFIKQNKGNIINISSTAGTKGFAGGTAYSATKFALKAMTQCWQAELRKHNVRVILINPSEVQTEFVANSGREIRPFNPSKLKSEDIAHTVCAALEMEDRGFITELTVFATNPQ
ncbi:MAG: SDR family oxidoreductase [Calditrichales bacterium]|nr:MAG: SDR family oxidoreductase [Calditrichales bacterium]